MATALVLGNKSAQADFVIGSKRPVYNLSASGTLTAATSGSLVSVTLAAAAVTVVLPAVAQGLVHRFEIAAAGTTGVLTVNAAGGTPCNGSFNGALVSAALGVSFPAAPPIGSWIEFSCMDGTSWSVDGRVGANATAPVVALAVSSTLTAAQSGSIIAITSAAADIAITLPAAAAGLNFKFLIAAHAGTNTITLTRAAAETFSGYLHGDPVAQRYNAATAVVLQSSALVGDEVTLHAATSAIWVVGGRVSNLRQATVTLGADRAIGVAESGCLFTMSAAAARIYTLPAVATSAGTRYRFVVGTAGANTITIRAATAVTIGPLNLGAAGAVTVLLAANHADVIFAVNQAIGAYVDYHCDGTKWYVHGQSLIAAGFTVN